VDEPQARHDGVTVTPAAPAPRVEAGVQLHLPSYLDRTLPELTRIAVTAERAGFDQVWLTDNPECRSTFVVLAVFAQAVRVKLGTAIMVQYLRSPVEAARGLLTVSELMEGRELSVGLGAGNPTSSRFISMPKPVARRRAASGSCWPAAKSNWTPTRCCRSTSSSRPGPGWRFRSRAPARSSCTAAATVRAAWRWPAS
jgi:alkanesulfonate monooxygenase SsuD/methylene tetrahydromethanopterin reductase-like flavin-dependent oxidoreductase (luciferase family)